MNRADACLPQPSRPSPCHWIPSLVVAIDRAGISRPPHHRKRDDTDRSHPLHPPITTINMAHPQPSMAARQFSPPQASSPSPSNAATAGSFSLPPSKRPKVSPALPHSQPNSPYGNSTPYAAAASPASGAVTPTATTALPSPGLPVNMAGTFTANTPAPQVQYNTSHQINGRYTSMAPTQQHSMVQSPIPTPSQVPAQPLHQSFQSPQPVQSPHQTSTPTTNTVSYTHLTLPTILLV